MPQSLDQSVGDALGLQRTPSGGRSRTPPAADFVNAVFPASSEVEVVASDAPVAGPSTLPALSDAAIARANLELADAAPERILEWAIDTLGRGLYQTTAFGLTGLVATDMISRISARRAAPGAQPRHLVPLIFLDTLYHFPETLALASRAQRRYGADLRVFKPEGVETAREFEDKYGRELWRTDEDSYDYLVKVEPARRAYNELGVQAVITGRRRSQGGDRTSIPVIEVDETGLLKINPLATWSFSRIKRYVDEHRVPYNELLDRGYTSVGDWHSTKPPKGIADLTGDLDATERSGRWSEQQGGKTECGLHKDYFRMKAAFKKRQLEAERAERDAARDKQAEPAALAAVPEAPADIGELPRAQL